MAELALLPPTPPDANDGSDDEAPAPPRATSAAGGAAPTSANDFEEAIGEAHEGELEDGEEYEDETSASCSSSDSDDAAAASADEDGGAPRPLDHAAILRIYNQTGRILTSFPEQEDAAFVFDGCGPFPLAYRTLSPQERLLLLFAENFRVQFNARLPARRPPLMAVANECGVQKMVCTTLRPTYVLHTTLLGDWAAMAAFVADFVRYEPLPDATRPVSTRQHVILEQYLLVAF